MKYMIISDLHGSETAVRKALDYFERSGAERLIILGDILYHGPRNPLPAGHNPQGVISLLNPLQDKIIAVRGNCEAEVDQMVLHFPCMSDYALIEDDVRIFATHGHIYNPQQLPHLPQNALFLYGHTHLWELRKNEQGITICNPGSIALPKGGNPATFAFYEDGKVRVIGLDDSETLAELSL